MNLTKMTKKEAIDIVEKIISLNSSQKLTPKDSYFLDQISFFVEQAVIENIRKRQKEIGKLEVTGHGQAAKWGAGDLTPGCTTCLHKSSFHAIRASSACNLKCKFCYYSNQEDIIESLLPQHYRINNHLMTKDNIKIMIDKQGSSINGLAWLYFEPFSEFDKHPELIEYISKKGIHQWLYTNGTLCTEENLKTLADCGLTEIRFNLAATNCSPKVLEAMQIARKYFKYLVIESPMIKEYWESFIKNKSQIIDTGVDHINCAELHLNQYNISNFSKERIYQYKNGYVSPVSSRQLTYDLIETAEKENWQNIVINDCSNELKYFRGIKAAGDFGSNYYSEEIGLPFDWFLDAMEQYDLPFES